MGRDRSPRAIARVLLVLFSVSAVSSPAIANPEGGIVAAGSATIGRPDAATVAITQHTDKAIVNWQSFSNSAGETVRFTQPSANSAILNRVTGGDPSAIHGQIQANGRVFLLNPNGILFGKTAQVNVGGLVASTLATSDADFMAGKHHLKQDPTKPMGAVVNHGTITAKPGGAVVLAAPVVHNAGTITAPQGRVALAAGREVTVSLDQAGLVNVAVPAAAAGDVTLSEEAADAALSAAVNNSALVEAGSVIVRDGKVTLVDAEGLAVNSGEIHTPGFSDPQRYANITLTASQSIHLGSESKISSDGTRATPRGGIISARARRVVVARGAKISAKSDFPVDYGPWGQPGGYVTLQGTSAVDFQGDIDTRYSYIGRQDSALGSLAISVPELRVVDQRKEGGLNLLKETDIERQHANVQISTDYWNPGHVTVESLTTDGALTMQPGAGLGISSAYVTWEDVTNRLDAEFVYFTYNRSVTTGHLNVQKDAALTVGGWEKADVKFSSITAASGAVHISSNNGDIQGGSITAGGWVGLYAGKVDVGDVMAREYVDMASRGSSSHHTWKQGISFRSITAQKGEVLIQSDSGTITGGDVFAGGARKILDTYGGIRINPVFRHRGRIGQSDVHVGSVTAKTGPISVYGRTLSAGNIHAHEGPVAIEALFDATIGALQTPLDATFIVGDDLTFDSLASSKLTMEIGRDVSGNSAVFTGALALSVGGTINPPNLFGTAPATTEAVPEIPPAALPAPALPPVIPIVEGLTDISPVVPPQPIIIGNPVAPNPPALLPPASIPAPPIVLASPSQPAAAPAPITAPQPPPGVIVRQPEPPAPGVPPIAVQHASVPASSPQLPEATQNAIRSGEQIKKQIDAVTAVMTTTVVYLRTSTLANPSLAVKTAPTIAILEVASTPLELLSIEVQAFIDAFKGSGVRAAGELAVKEGAGLLKDKVSTVGKIVIDAVSLVKSILPVGDALNDAIGNLLKTTIIPERAH